MSFVEGFGGDASPSNAAGFMSYHLSIGSSSNEALREWRSLGGTFGNEAWRSLYAQVGDAIARQADMAALEPWTIPSAGDYGEFAMGRGGQYATQVRILMQDAETGVQSLRWHTYVTSDPHTPAEAEADAWATFGDPDTLNAYGETMAGAFTTAVYITTPWES